MHRVLRHIDSHIESTLELAELAQSSAFRLLGHAIGAAGGGAAPAPFEPKPYDHRFVHPAWRMPPFSLWQQGFLAVQDWWDQATDRLRGLRTHDADRMRFQARQTLDLVAPSNFPWLNPEIIEATLESCGRNLVEGAGHAFSEPGILDQLIRATDRYAGKEAV